MPLLSYSFLSTVQDTVSIVYCTLDAMYDYRECELGVYDTSSTYDRLLKAEATGLNDASKKPSQTSAIVDDISMTLTAGASDETSSEGGSVTEATRKMPQAGSGNLLLRLLSSLPSGPL